MRAKDWMAFDPVTVTRETTVREARTLMRSRGVRHLPVVGEGHVVGMLSDRDVQITDLHLEEISARGDVEAAAGAAQQVPVLGSMRPAN
jgi:signal-transduction protein with cAMP-binding, CBS, and nucleotidyltransferase domain